RESACNSEYPKLTIDRANPSVNRTCWGCLRKIRRGKRLGIRPDVVSSGTRTSPERNGPRSEGTGRGVRPVGRLGRRGPTRNLGLGRPRAQTDLSRSDRTTDTGGCDHRVVGGSGVLSEGSGGREPRPAGGSVCGTA